MITGYKLSTLLVTFYILCNRVLEVACHVWCSCLDVSVHAKRPSTADEDIFMVSSS